MNNQHSKLNQTAARWFIRMQGVPLDSPERSQFERWLMQSESHQAEYVSISETWDGIDSLDDLKIMAANQQANKFLNQNKRSKKIKSTMALLSICFVVIFTGLFGHNQYQEWLTKPTMKIASESASAQILTQRLEDGSEITLNANSKVQVTYYRKQRHVALLQGEAIFNVTKDTERPFVVDAGNARVKVLGTRFSVNKLSRLVRVSVDHGSVQVQSVNPERTIILRNGEVAEVQNGKAVLRKNANAADYLQFATGAVVFNHADIFEIVDVLSRYRQKEMLAKGNSQEKISAVFNVKDLETFIDTLPKIANVEVQNTQDSTIIQAGK